MFLKDEAIQHPRNMLPTVTSQRAFGENFWIVSKSWLPGETKFLLANSTGGIHNFPVKKKRKKGRLQDNLSDLASPVQIG